MTKKAEGFSTKPFCFINFSILIHLNELFERLDGSVSRELAEFLIVLGLVELEVVADRADNCERHLVHIANVTDGAAFHLAAQSVKFKGDTLALTSVDDEDVA